ncbi:DUF6246 family protein [Rouxiella badensis]|uniref:DUF6246 family protein n=1 Tax=Rouxiella badensis TaxID=1646377 RepID=UPI002AD54FEF|nr:DUF6246 family protein [Rouxiella badensis]
MGGLDIDYGGYMTPLREIGECVISAGNEDYFFRPSFANMTRIGSPQEIVQAYGDLHNDEVKKMTLGLIASIGCLPVWFLRYADTCSGVQRALVAAMSIMSACADRDVTTLTGEIIPAKTRGRSFRWKKGAMELQDILLIASSLITHGVIGKAKIRQLQRHESKQTTNEFKAFDYISAARTHFKMSRQDAEMLTMTEFILLLNAKYPNQQGFTHEEYDAVVDDYFAKKERRLKKAAV